MRSAAAVVSYILMKALRLRTVLAGLGLALTAACTANAPAPDPAETAPARLASWNDGATKQAIVSFVRKVTTPGTPDFVPVGRRIAAFDNDGTLWAEQPMYFQVLFAFDRLKALAADHPAWRTTMAFKAILEGHPEQLSGADISTVLAVTQGGMSTDALQDAAAEWLRTARHPRFDRPFTDLTFQPMLEMLGYLRAQGFKTFIVSGGGLEFMRAFAEPAYGIPPEQVVGSSLAAEFALEDGRGTVMDAPAFFFVNDRGGKPVGISTHIGRRPLIAFGNSDGDLEMLQYTTAGDGVRLGVIIHHTDATREWAYDRESSVGRLNKALDEAPTRGWVVVSMKDDWKRVFRFDP
jgi:hypothetical protein